MMSGLSRRIVLTVSALLLISFVATSPIIPSVASAQMSALLPALAQVPAKNAMALDGIWLVNTINKKIRIEGGRAYAVDSWVHLFTLKVEPDMVVIKDINAMAPGKYTGWDLPLIGNWVASIDTDRSLAVNVSGLAGPSTHQYKLIPVQLDNPEWYGKEMQMMGVAGVSPSLTDNTQSSGTSPKPTTAPVYVGDQGDSSLPPVPPPAENQQDRLCPGKGAEGEEPCLKVAAIEHEKAQVGCPGARNYLSLGQCYSCPKGYRRTNPLRVMSHPQACQKEKAFKPAKLTSKRPFLAGCTGLDIYLSEGRCYQCPEGYKRAHPTNKMANNPRACKLKRRPNTYTKAKSPVPMALGCPAGQFAHQGMCKSCPEGSKRNHVAGFDTGNCRVPIENQCLGSLLPAQLAPANDDQWEADKGGHKGCAPPFDINAAALSVLQADNSIKIKSALLNLANVLKSPAFMNALKSKNWHDAWFKLNQIDEFHQLIEMVRETGHRSISVGGGQDLSLGAGMATEMGFAIDLVDMKFKIYQAKAHTKGVSIGWDRSFSIGVWKGAFTTSYSQGYVIDLHLLLGGNAGVWFSYYDPARPEDERGPEKIGITVGIGGGGGIEVGEYNQVTTQITKSCGITLPDSDCSQRGPCSVANPFSCQQENEPWTEGF